MITALGKCAQENNWHHDGNVRFFVVLVASFVPI